MVDIIIGGPVFRREWIILDWYDHVNVACLHAGLVPQYLHVLPVDDPTNELLAPGAIVVHTDEPGRIDRRVWNDKRYRHMAEIRNQGLAAVREHKPRWFLSLDSDILLDPRGIGSLINALEQPALEKIRFDAVGGKCFMTDTKAYPSYGMFTRSGGIRRTDVHGGLFPVEVIMAIKLMSPAAYAVDYEFHLHGEDLGWSKAARAAGLRLGWDGRVENRHVFKRPQ